MFALINAFDLKIGTQNNIIYMPNIKKPRYSKTLLSENIYIIVMYLSLFAAVNFNK